MQKPRQREFWSARILTVATFAFLAILPGCSGHSPTDLPASPEPAIDLKPMVAQSGDRCILINGQLYCY